MTTQRSIENEFIRLPRAYGLYGVMCSVLTNPESADTSA